MGFDMFSVCILFENMGFRLQVQFAPHPGAAGGDNVSLSWMTTAVKHEEEEERLYLGTKCVLRGV